MQRALVLIALAAATGCTGVLYTAAPLVSHTTRADDAIVYDTPKLQMRVVRYRVYEPFSTISYSYEVQCKPEGNQWKTITGGLNGVPPNAKALAKDLRQNFQVFDDGILVWNLFGVPRISVDGCQNFRVWQPTSIDASLIDPAPIWPKEKEPAPLEAKPWFCAKPDLDYIDCRQYEFGGNRGLHYSNVAVTADGTVSFDVTSRAFKDVHTLHVESHDWGATWSYHPVD